MFIKVTRQAAVAALLRGETVFCLQTGEGWQLCEAGELPHPHFRSKSAIRHFLAFNAHFARDLSGEKVIEWCIHRE